MDLELTETNNGGDFIKNGRDLSVIYGFENMPYLAMFGGNTEGSTPSRRNPAEQAKDYWANSLLFKNDPTVQMNSETERALKNTPLNSFGLGVIQQAVNKDLNFMKAFSNVSVIVSMIGINRIAIAVRIVKPGNLSQNVFVFIWDATNLELLARGFANTTGGDVSLRIFDDTFDFSFE